MSRIITVFILFTLFVACTPDDSQAPRLVTRTPNRLGTLAHSTMPPLAVSVYNEPTDAPSDPIVPEPPLPAKPCEPYDPTQAHTRYQVNAVLDWDDAFIEVDQSVTYTNTTGAYQEEIVFQVEPNRLSGIFAVTGIRTHEDRKIDNVILESSRMTVVLPGGLGENCPITLHLSYTMTIPPLMSETDYVAGRIGYFGYTDKQINLGHWMPVVALYQNHVPFDPDQMNQIEPGWYTPPPSTNFIGEQTTTEISDFDLTLQLIDAPEDATVIGPGTVTIDRSNKIWEFELNQARDLTISAVTGVHRTSQNIDNRAGTVIEVYYYPENEPATFEAAEEAKRSAADALLLFEEVFGLEYPYQRLVIMQGDFPDGMEFTGLVFVSKQWFKTWRGIPNDWLTVITVHEVAHQWWYALIGNDPAAYPYLDEAFATYSEYLYYERYYPDQVSWWWRFRVTPHTPAGSVDSTIYGHSTTRAYINAVYLRGAQMLHDLRTELGDEAFFAWLKSYAAENQYQIANSTDFWVALSDAQYADTATIRQNYLEQPEILPVQTVVPAIEAPSPVEESP